MHHSDTSWELLSTFFFVRDSVCLAIRSLLVTFAPACQNKKLLKWEVTGCVACRYKISIPTPTPRWWQAAVPRWLPEEQPVSATEGCSGGGRLGWCRCRDGSVFPPCSTSASRFSFATGLGEHGCALSQPLVVWVTCGSLRPPLQLPSEQSLVKRWVDFGAKMGQKWRTGRWHTHKSKNRH